MKKYIPLLQRGKKKFSLILGMGDITGTPQRKIVHLRYFADAMREEAGIFFCLAAVILSIRTIKTAVLEWIWGYLGKEKRQRSMVIGKEE